MSDLKCGCFDYEKSKELAIRLTKGENMIDTWEELENILQTQDFNNENWLLYREEKEC